MISYMDMLTLSWEEMNCGQAVAEGLRRMGMAEAADTIPVNAKIASAVVAGGAVNDSRWTPSPGPPVSQRAAGTVIVTEDAGELGVMLVLGRGMALTSLRRHGVKALPLSRVQNWIGCYRWGGA